MNKDLQKQFFFTIYRIRRHSVFMCMSLDWSCHSCDVQDTVSSDNKLYEY